MPHLLEGSAVAGAVSTGVRGVERINRFFSQHLRQVFQGGRLAAAEENLTVHIADDGVRIVLVDGFQLTSRLQNKAGGDLTATNGRHQLFQIGDLPDVGALVDQAPHMDADTKRLAISGCSFAGKMALFAGAFDERIALTIAQEPGGGGAAAWRVSETLGEVETLGRTSHAWFKESMFQYKEDNVSKLPYDHHELCAMVAPRALLVLGNPDYVWLADESGYVSCRAARKVWETFGIADRMGFSIVGGHGHCQLPESQYPEVEAFVDKFLLGKKDANTEVTIAPLYEKVDYERWLFH